MIQYAMISDLLFIELRRGRKVKRTHSARSDKDRTDSERKVEANMADSLFVELARLHVDMASMRIQKGTRMTEDSNAISLMKNG